MSLAPLDSLKRFLATIRDPRGQVYLLLIESPAPMTKRQIQEETKLPTSTLNRALDFLYDNRFISRFQGRGNQAYYFTKIL